MADTRTFTRLFEPLEVGPRRMRNRIVHAPMSVCYADQRGFVTRPQIEHYARRAQGGAGMIITENFAVAPAGRQLPRQTMVHDEEHVPGLAALAAEIHRHDSLAVAQIVHAGRYAGPWDVYEQARRLAPSAVAFELTPGRTVTPQEITPAEIDEAVAAFVRAARLLERAGFDGVEIHGAQGFLLASFLSPIMNRRTDEWGGSLANRARLLRTVVAETVRATGDEFVVGVQLMSDELVPGGLPITDTVRMVPWLEEDGARFVLPAPATFETMRMPPNLGLFGRRTYALSDIAAVTAVATVPVIGNGGFADPADAVAALERGDADAIGLARPLFTDPDWPRKVAAGDLAAIHTCACDPPTCLRTQLTGGICHSWPAGTQARGYLGYDVQEART